MSQYDKNVKISKERIDSYLKGALTVKYNLDTIDVTDGIDWDYVHSHNSNTYQTYLHSLNILKDFTRLCSTGVNNYTQYGKALIENWIENNKEENSLNHAWNEHAVSSRIINIIDFQESHQSEGLERNMFNDMLLAHCKYLNDEKNYKLNNHGLMMDNALLYASRHLRDENLKTAYVDKVLYRIKYALYRDFSRKGVHLENSPEYHRVALILLTNIEKTLDKLALSLGKDATALLKRARLYRTYIMKPDCSYPLIGDTGTIQEKNVTKNYADFIDYDAGIAILQNKNNEKRINSGWMTFKSGYHSMTHKHRDDLSVTLYLDGHDVLIDSGKYSYKKDDPIRQYLVSPDAHNTVSVSGKDYHLSNPMEEQFGLKISKYMKKGKHKIISGVNKLYTDINIIRHSVFTEDNILFIIDHVSGSEVEIFKQNFHFNTEANVDKVEDFAYEIHIGNDKYILKSFMLNEESSGTELLEGKVSRSFSNYDKINKVSFSKVTKKDVFITALYNCNKGSVTNVNLSNGVLSYTYLKEYRKVHV
ncbi:hypothetical protein FO441_00980 [Salinicoccus cyprini]|uniref:Uncharacterized protein n=1 Tax=Salinicoccus cyprini TaxID=2493691 RepID=A0A558AX97_9STAP|nr:heparinase II/III family protein [Salinicoccus cyprini]TVT28885.1 hypothetical protein FO441_00980 [Salinicoccus cyprini]